MKRRKRIGQGQVLFGFALAGGAFTMRAAGPCAPSQAAGIFQVVVYLAGLALIASGAFRLQKRPSIAGGVAIFFILVAIVLLTLVATFDVAFAKCFTYG